MFILKKNLSLKKLTFIWLFIIKRSYLHFIHIKKVNFKYSILFLPHIIRGYIFSAFHDNFNQLIKEKKNYFENKYTFYYNDWFSSSIPIWETLFKNITKIKYLEIGAFEGRSALFVGELTNLHSIMCVDTFMGSDEHENIDFKIVFNNFKNNLIILNKHNVSFTKSTSDHFFKNNKFTYNLIYIDGAHNYDAVKNDFINSFNALEVGGLLIIDDFFWSYYDKLNKNPLAAVLDCYKIFNKNLEIVSLYQQIVFKKKS